MTLIGDMLNSCHNHLLKQ